MAQQTPPPPINNPITMEHVVAALQHLGFALSQNFGDGSVPFAITTAPATGSAPAAGSAPTAGSASTAGPAPAAGSAPTADSAPAGVGANPVWTSPDAASAATAAVGSLANPVTPTVVPLHLGDPRSPYTVELVSLLPNRLAGSRFASRRPPAPPAAPGPSAPPAGGASATEVVAGNPCPTCSAHGDRVGPYIPTTSGDPWYTVTIGRQVGVFHGWHLAGPLVTGVRGFCVKKYNTREEVQAAFDKAFDCGVVEVRT
ncbi:hypothetical protein Hypma_005154 [Hypsizygus marmoreus]|uniref:Ribonuclease H1 N-terminal domain-containing protein n=1 Tax=Hypsizygus marmoreus TaxID=39966 RepID=A0A369K570_HYPMA|nr:hypothetical protein Hypma_005154 [Hypsizygus marmoreus]